MKRAMTLIALGGCVGDGTPDWQLDYDRIVAVRAEPPALPPGVVGRLDVLVAHVGAPTTIEAPQTMSAPGSPLFTAVHYNIDHYEIDGPDEAQLVAARAELGLPDGALVPLEVELRVSGPLYAKKLVLLGAAATNPVLPAVMIDGAVAGSTIDVAAHRDTPLLIEATTAHWFTSCGELVGEREASARLVTGGACEGELVVVVREGENGVAWGVWPIRVR
ncbi:MAG TPA: hypothetical protein VMZ53_10350 [Kofleriaceae bacterium]|nr:hypothetical protein [Kofleriaceae bacterium]